MLIPFEKLQIFYKYLTQNRILLIKLAKIQINNLKITVINLILKI